MFLQKLRILAFPVLHKSVTTLACQKHELVYMANRQTPEHVEGTFTFIEPQEFEMETAELGQLDIMATRDQPSPF